MGTNLWFGGHRRLELGVTVEQLGGLLTLIVTVAVEGAPSSSVIVTLIVFVPPVA
jgi:hypothetical protein